MALGTSLTAINAAFTLLEDDGHFVRAAATGEIRFEPRPDCRHVILHSRAGLLPKVRSTLPAPKRESRYLKREDAWRMLDGSAPPLGHDEAMRLLRQELEHAWDSGGDGGDPQPPFDWDGLPNPLANATSKAHPTLHILEKDLRQAKQPSPAWLRVHYTLRQAWGTIAPLFHRFPLKDTRRFDAKFFRVFTTFGGAMPMENSEVVRALIRAGCLEVLSGVQEIAPDEMRGCFSITYTGAERRD